MRAVSLCIAALTLAGCASGYVKSDTACEAPVMTLTPDLTAHLDAGDKDGSFSYDPRGELLASMIGTYDTVTGDFTWTELGGGASWIDRAEVQGFGYAARDGDLDIIGERTITDVLGESRRQQFRIQRTGCHMERSVRDWTINGEREESEVGDYSGSTYTYTQDLFAGGQETHTEGRRFLDLTFEETATRSDASGTYSAEITGNWGDSTSLADFEQTILTRRGTITRDGTVENHTDGSRSVDYSEVQTDGSTYRWTYDVDYAGDGSGTLTVGSTQCTLTFQQSSCTYSCPGGQAGRC